LFLQRYFLGTIRVIFATLSESRATVADDVPTSAGIPNANFGKDGNRMQLSPPLTVSDAEIDQLVGVLGGTLSAVSDW